ncbi:MAG TPA: hypothetical protein GX736_03640 [Mogibacterium sp.]|nr:hypothetical protein [Mogibacterium sp.]
MKRKVKKIIAICIVLIITTLILNCINSYKLVKAIYSGGDRKEVESILKKPGIINGVNIRPYVIPPSTPFLAELFGSINQQPLHAACLLDKYEIVQLLVDHGANVNIHNYANRRNSPLFTALKQEHHENRFKIAKFLIKNGADIDYENSKKEVALTLCLKQSYHPERCTKEVKQEQMELFIYLLKNSKSLDVPEYKDVFYSYTSLLDAAILYDNREAVQYLMDNGYYSEADIPKLNGSHSSYLAKRAGLGIFKQYFDIKDINSRDEEGRTPLHNAVIGYKTETCEFLIENGADLNIKDNNGETVYDYIENTLENADLSAETIEYLEKLLELKE